MAKLTKKEEHIVEMYVRYFGTVATEEQIKSFDGVKSLSKITAEIRKDADNSKTGLTPTEFLNDVFQNLFGRDANPKELKYVKTIENNKNLPIATIIKNGSRDDKAVYEAKKAVALFIAEKGSATDFDLDKITKKTYAEIYNPKTKKLLVDSVAQLETKIDAMPDNVSGTTFNLTTGVDMGSKFVGTEKGDIYYAFDTLVSGVSTTAVNAFDTLDGKEGNDILEIQTGVAIGGNPVLKSIETVNVKSATSVTLDGSNWEGTNTLNVTQAANTVGSLAANLKAAATTDVNVSGVTGNIVVKGGNDVVVTDSKAGSTITVGDTAVGGVDATGTITITDTDNSGANAIIVEGGTDVTVTTTADKASSGDITIGHVSNGMATGNVVVTQNTTSNGTAAITAGDVTVTGGKTVEITANMTNTAVKAGTTGNNITAGTYTVNGGNTTTDVTITQNATATDFENDAAAATFETAVVTFGALKAGESVAISYGTQNLTGAVSNDLTFTASKDLTAEQVAAAFANLTDTTDTQSATGITANGYFTGKLDAGWTSGAVSGNTVTFTATTAGVLGSDITVNTDATNDWSSADNATANANFGVVVTQGVAAGGTTAVNVTENFGNVVVDDNATKSITTITLDGFDSATLGATVVAGAPGASSLDKLATLNLTNGQGTGTTALTSTVATLNVTLNDMAGTVDLDGAAATTLKTLNLTTTGEASDITLSAAAVETLTIAAGADLDISTTPAGYATTALDNVTIKGAGSVNLGVISTATGLVSFNASANTGGVTATVDANATTMTALNADGYVFSAGNDDVTLSASTVSTKVTLGAGDDIVTLDAGTTVLAAVIDGGTGSDTLKMIVADAAGVTTLADGAFEAKITGFEKLSLGATAASTAAAVNLSEFDDISYVISAGTGATGGTLGLSKMANNGTLELTGALLSAVTVTMKDATASTDTFNIVTKVDASNVTSTGAVVVANVETINVTATDISPVDTVETSPTFGQATISEADLILTATAAKTVNVTGNSDIDLSTGATAHANLKTVDASAMTGDLTYTINSSVADFALTSGSGADDITVAASNNAQVKTGAGADTITVQAGAVSANIWGGAGNDVFDVTGTISSATQYVTIEDATAGDQIILDTTHFLSGSVSITDFDQMTLTDKFNAVLGDTGLNVDRGADDSFAISFQHAGNTYIVVSDGTVGSNFGAAGTDQVIKLTGLKDLSAGASFNVDGTLEIA